MDFSIKLENIGKKYTLFHQNRERYKTLRDTIGSSLKNIFKPGKINTKKEEFWALKEISFEIKEGDKVGIIGRNGAGKSTLLKILSRITEPTTGKFTIKGRVASLLEVGTGFHPELTGRENIYLNGSILGMKRSEIKKKFDEIVAFSEVEKFLDTPVKRYSSGMYVRLAFSVAAHLEPEILIVDEVLAVGDASFQKKCLGKMGEIGESGRTVLFVSHNMEAITRLCNSSILLKNGQIENYGITENVIKHYMTNLLKTNSNKKWDDNQFSENQNIRLLEIKLHNVLNQEKDNFDITKPIGITFSYEVLKDNLKFIEGINVYNDTGVNIFDSHNVFSKFKDNSREKGIYKSTVWIKENLLSEGIFTIGFALFNTDPFTVYFHEKEVLSFNVYDNINGDSARGNYAGPFPGIIRPLLDWNTEKL